MAKSLMAVLIAGILSPALAPAQAMECGPRAVLLADLDRSYQEAVTGRGLAGDGPMVELFTAQDGSTWTILFTPPDNPTVSCIATSGAAWNVVAFKPWGEGL